MKWPLKIHVQRTSEFKYHFLFYCLYILYIQTWSRSRHSAVRMKYLRLRALAIFYLSAHFFNTWQSAQHCAHLVLSHLWAKFLLYTPFCQRIWIIWIIIKCIHMRIKNICTCFLLFSLCFLELSCILQNLVVVCVAT